MTNPDNAGGLPELPPNVGHLHSTDDYCPERAIKTSEWPVNLYTADQMRRYGEQCRAASGDESPDPNVEDVRRMLLERSKVGLGKYGVTTFDSHEDLAGWLNHALTETLDNAVYLRAAIRALSRGVPEGK